MGYKIEGLQRERFAPLLGQPEETLAKHGALRVVASGKPGFPCRISLEDAEPGESLILLNFVSHQVDTPFRSAYAIYVRETGGPAARFVDEIPPMLSSRALGLRGFDEKGMLRAALLALPGQADEHICSLFERPEIASIHAHNAAHGCFLARIERN